MILYVDHLCCFQHKSKALCSFPWAGSRLKVVYLPRDTPNFHFQSREVSQPQSCKSGSSLCLLDLADALSLALPSLPSCFSVQSWWSPACSTAASPSLLLKLISKSRCFPCVSLFIFFPTPTCSNASNNLSPWSFRSNPKIVQASLNQPPQLGSGAGKKTAVSGFSPMIIHGEEKTRRFNLGTAFGSHFTFRLSALALVLFSFLPGTNFYFLEIFC